jgi:hypothetical protein
MITTTKKSRYWKDIPGWLRLIGCFAIEGRCYRFRWGEVSIGWDLGFGYSVYHESATLRFAPLFFSLYLKAPMLIKQRPGTEDWNASYGVSYHSRAFQFSWRTACKIIHLPWDWDHVRHTYLWPDGRVHHHCARGEWQTPEEIKSSHPYTYVRESGEVQHRIATIYGDEREWRWRWFKWLPWPRRTCRSVGVDFDQEVGEGTGSWKGGVLGCSTEWKKGETQLQALRRMERERKFTR